jgi:hypothetical protein
MVVAGNCQNAPDAWTQMNAFAEAKKEVKKSKVKMSKG